MARKLKNKWLGARVDDDTYAQVDGYIEAAEISMGDLLRAAVDEYIINHPVKQPVEPLGAQLEPGRKEAS